MGASPTMTRFGGFKGCKISIAHSPSPASVIISMGWAAPSYSGRFVMQQTPAKVRLSGQKQWEEQGGKEAREWERLSGPCPRFSWLNTTHYFLLQLRANYPRLFHGPCIYAIQNNVWFLLLLRNRVPKTLKFYLPLHSDSFFSSLLPVTAEDLLYLQIACP